MFNCTSIAGFCGSGKEHSGFIAAGNVFTVWQNINMFRGTALLLTDTGSNL